VLAVMEAAARLGLARPLVGLVPATENLPGPDALKPGDIVTINDGTTVEVVNTDAEGRLVLADAIAYAVREYRPAALIDVATLTGAAIIGLGHHRTALMGNDDRLAAAVLAAGEHCGEELWRLPLGKEYAKQLESRVADLKNIGGKPAGTITAACFLEHFVGDTPWVHLDIAGTAWDYTEKSYVPKGPSGVGVRTLIEFLRRFKTGTARR
jgi:leucyl aminopeptidase